MAMQGHRRILHVDMDAFFAAIEQRDDPALRGQPVAVGRANARGVVAAASYEARKFGVRSAMPSATALRKCPELIFVPPRFEVYRAVSGQIRAIFLEYTPLVEPLSLDEAYLDVTANLRRLPSATATAREIRQRIFETTGLTASAGISYNKLLAKLASDRNKPNGQYVVTPAHGPEFVTGLEVGRFHGIGPKTAAKMQAMGILTGADLKALSLAELQARFGKAGAWYHAIARGQDDRPVMPDRPRKSAGAETTFAHDLIDRAAIEAAVCEQADAAWRRCDRHAAYGRTVTVKIRFSDFRIITRSRTLGAPVTDREALRHMAVALVHSIFPPPAGIRLLGVSVSGFDSPRDFSPKQLHLQLR
ncbi:MAG: DNA polymerase IV [Sphingomonadaceae bacterium]